VSDFVVCLGVGADTRGRLLRVRPWLMDWQRRWGVVVFTVLLEL
jgi:hypothetical protein